MEDVIEMKNGDSMQILPLKHKLCLALSGVVFFPLLHQFTGLLIRRYCSWMEKGSVFRISTRVVSGIQALLAIMISARTIFICKDIMTDVDPFIHAYIWFAISYFPYDIVVMYLGYAYKEAQSKAHLSFIQSFWSFFLREPVLVLHHIIFLAVGLPIVEVYKRTLGDFFLACFFLAEGSTPFYNIRGILKEVGIKDGKMFIVNGLLFLVTFLLCRVLSVPFMFLRYSYYADIPVTQVPLKIPYKCTFTCLSFFLLQFYWFILICRVIKRMFSQAEDKTE